MTSPLTNEERDGLVKELASLAELDTLGGFWATADIHRRAADKISRDAAEITRLRAEVERLKEAAMAIRAVAAWDDEDGSREEVLAALQLVDAALARSPSE